MKRVLPQLFSSNNLTGRQKIQHYNNNNNLYIDKVGPAELNTDFTISSKIKPEMLHNDTFSNISKSSKSENLSPSSLILFSAVKPYIFVINVLCLM